jgi:hypothetical protein
VDLEAFTAAVEHELQLRHVAFDLRDLQTYLEDERHAVADEPDPAAWATAFVRRERAVAGSRD